MSISRFSIGLATFALSVATLGAFGGVAEADGVEVIVAPPFFFPAGHFDYSDGYYRNREGRYYHYDRDRDGWHYGRNHGEGQRYEARHRGGKR